MLSQEDINNQKRRLTILRQNVTHLLQQAALAGGTAFASALVVNSIAENRREIRQIKESLFRYGIVLESAPVDEESSAEATMQPANPTGVPATTSPQTVINTGGGDYAGRDIHKNSSIKISGGTIYGPVVAHNAGTISSSYTHTANQTLELVYAQVQALIADLRTSGNEDTADDLESVQTAIKLALKAQSEGKSDRRLAKISEARQLVQGIAADANHPPNIQALVKSIEGIA